jgi:hypothetical protein
MSKRDSGNVTNFLTTVNQIDFFLVVHTIIGGSTYSLDLLTLLLVNTNRYTWAGVFAPCGFAGRQ